MANNRFSLQFDFNGNIEPIKNSINELRKNLNGINLPDSFATNFTKMFGKLENEVKNFEAMTKNGFNNIADVNKAQTAFSRISKMINQITLEVGRVKGIEPERLLPKEIQSRAENLRKKLVEVQKQANKKTGLDEEIKKQNKEIEDQIVQLERLKIKRDALNKEIKSSSGSIGSQTKKKNAAIANKEGIVAKMTELEGQKGGKTSVQYKELNAELTRLNSTIKNCDSEIARLTTGINKNKTTIASLDGEINDTNNTITNLKSKLVELKNTDMTPEGLLELRKQIAKIKGTDLDNVTSDLNELNNIINNLNGKEVSKLTPSLKQAELAVEQLDNATDEAKQGLQETADTARDFDDAAKQVENLKNQVFYFFSLTNSVYLFRRAVTQALNTVKELDATMTEAAVVTEFSVGDMWDKLPEYSAEAQKLGVSINGMYQATTLYYQQGLKTNEAMELGIETMKMAKIANMESAEATEAMTAALRGFNMELNETSAVRVNDVYSELAAVTAADTNQIATAMSKTASIASSANMEFETTAALLAQIIETTQEAPETAGTALKTIIARFAEVKELRDQGLNAGVDEEGEEINVNNIQKALRTVGISMDEFFAGTKGLDEILLELASKWDTLDFETQRYIATTAAGSRQQSRFIAMMSDYERTTELVAAANDSAGASQEQFSKTLESMESKLQNLKNTWDQFLMGLANNDILKGAVDTLSFILETINKLIDSISGGNGLLKSIFTLSTAFMALKVGKSILGSGLGFIGNFFGGNSSNTTNKSQALGAKDGQVYGQAFIQRAQATINNWKGLNVKIDKNNLKNTLTNSLKSGFGTFITGKEAAINLNQLQFTGEISDSLKREVYDNLNLQVSRMNLNSIDVNTSKSIESIMNNIETGKLQEASLEAEKLGINLAVSGKAAKAAGAEYIGVEQKLSRVASSCAITGAALLGLINSWKPATEGGQVFKNILTGIGISLMSMPILLKIAQAAFKAFGVSVSTTIYSIPIIGWIAGITTALGALIGLIVGFVNIAQSNSLEAQLEDAEKATERAQQAAEEAKNAYDELLNGESKYNELQETLENLTKGTNEWKEALISANQQVLELIQTYPELAKYIQRGEDGQLTISQEGWDIIKEQQEQLVQNTSGMAVMSLNNEQNIKSKMAYEELDALTLGDSEIVNRLRELISIKDFGTLEFDQALQDISDTSIYTTAQLEEMINAISKYDKALAENQQIIDSQTQAFLSTQVSEETQKFTDRTGIDVTSVFSKAGGRSQDNNIIQTTASNLYKNDSKSEALNNEDFKKLMEEYNVSATNNDKKDLQNLYKAMTGTDASEEIKNDKNKLAQEIAKIDVANTLIETMEDFRERLQKQSKEDQKKIAALFSGNASMFNLDELGQIGNIDDYAKKLGYSSTSEMGEALGYTEKTIGELDREDQIKALEKLSSNGFINIDTNQLQNMTSEELTNLINANSSMKIGADWQLEIDINQMKEELEKVRQTAIEEIKEATNLNETEIQNYMGEYSIGTTQNISKQLSSFSDTSQAGEYVKNLQKLVNNAGTSSEEISQYLSNINWSSMTEAIDAMDYLQSKGLDSSLIKEYWDTATNGANTYISNLNEILTLTGLMQKKMTDISDISDKLEEGTASYNDIMTLAESGADISSFQLTPEGWKATADQIEEATKKLKEFNAEQSKDLAEQQLQEWTEAKNKITGIVSQKDGNFYVNEGYKLGAITSLSEDKKTLIGGTVEASNVDSIAESLGVAGQGIEEETEDFIARIQEEYDKYINLLNNGQDIQVIANKMAASASAMRYTADENAIQRGTDESVRYSMQNEAMEAGLDANEVTDASESLREIETLEKAGQQVRDRLALDIALASQAAKTITENYEEWGLAIEDGPANPKYASSMKELIDSTSKLLGVSESVAENLVKEKKNRELVEKAAQGDIEAYKELQKLGTKEVVASFEIDEDTSEEEIQGIIDYINNTEFPVLEVGTSLDSDPIYSAFASMIESAGLTATQMSAALEAFHFEPDIDWIPIEMASTADNGETYTYTDPSGNQHTIKGSSKVTMNGKSYLPIINGNTTVAQPPKPAADVEKTSSSGGGSSKEWENPYDELYNVVEKINIELRQRNKIERDYNRILEGRGTTGTQLLKNTQEQLDSLSREKALQEQLMAGRKRQIQEFESENSNMQQYGKLITDKNGNIGVQINWNLIDSITDEEKGQEIEDYISRLEELRDQVREVEDSLYDIEDSIKELYEQGKDEYFSLEEAVMSALQETYQERIDDAQRVSDAISESNSDLIDSIQNSINDTRQARDNQKTEKELSDKQLRLAYLQQDTSGANQLEILQLQKEIEEGQEDYTDTLIDQKISKLQEQNELAAEQRQTQIDIAQAQLDYAIENGKLWPEVEGILESGISKDGTLIKGSELETLLKKNGDVASLSALKQIEWLEEIENQVASGFAWLKQGNSTKGQVATGQLKAGQSITFTNNKGQSITGKVQQDGTVLGNDGKTYTDVYQDYTGQYVSDKAGVTTTQGQNNTNKTESNSGRGKINSLPDWLRNSNDIKTLQMGLNDLLKDKKISGFSKLVEDGILGPATKNAIRQLQAKIGTTVDGLWGPNTRSKFKKSGLTAYKTGGLADFTGPAWLDGTKSKPELVLNQEDTQNFLILRDILSSFIKNPRDNTNNSGDNYFEIYINVDEIGSQYDVEKIANDVQDLIRRDAANRNVNVTGIKR